MVEGSSKPENSRRKQGGRFRPGQSGNPAGKPKGARNLTSRAVEALLEGELEALTRKAIEVALRGDTTALRLCLDRIAPARRDSPVSVALPAIKSAKDILEASAAILEGVSCGTLTPDEAARVMALLNAHRAIVETADLEVRIAALEDQNSGT